MSTIATCNTMSTITTCNTNSTITTVSIDSGSRIFANIQILNLGYNNI